MFRHLGDLLTIKILKGRIRDQTPTVKPQDLIATVKTKQHIKDTKGHQAGTSSTDPWTTGEDPWGGYKATKPLVAPTSHHVQSKFDDVEQRLQDHVEAKITAELQSRASQDSTGRIDTIENHSQSLAANQQKLEKWIHEGNAKVKTVHQECAQLQAAVSEQGQTLGTMRQEVTQVFQQVTSQGNALQQVVQDVAGINSGLTNHLDRYFAQQEERIVNLLANRQHWLGRCGPSSGLRKVPKLLCSIKSIFLLWIHMVLCFGLIRVGEASVPGPAARVSQDGFDSFIDPPAWTFAETPVFSLGTGNPGGLANKMHYLEHFPSGWFHLTETQATQYQQCAFQKQLKGISWKTGRKLRSTWGAPAPYRPGSSTSGSWTGVMSFADIPLRNLPCPWPADQFSSGRALISSGFIGQTSLVVATAYCPPKGPTFPRAAALSEQLLQPITEEVVVGRSGLRAIVGDSNAAPLSLEQMRIWADHGWMEVQALMEQWRGITPQPTCKGRTFPDQIWVSPELAVRIMNISVWNIFPDHSMVMVGLRMSVSLPRELQWRLPGHIPWNQIDDDRWTSESVIDPMSLPRDVHEGCPSLAPVPTLGLPDFDCCPTSD